MPKRCRDGRNAVLFMATTFVMSSGIILCSFIVTAFDDDVSQPMMAVVGLFLGTAGVLWLSREKSEEEKNRPGPFCLLISLFRRRSADLPRRKYRPVRKKYLQIEEYGTNHPPSVESIRQQLNNLNTFVPHDKHRTHPEMLAAQPPSEDCTARGQA